MKIRINFACTNCLNIFDFETTDICFDKKMELKFTPRPVCPECGATQEVELSHYGIEQIDDLVFSNKIRTK